MAVKAVLASLDGVPDAFKSEYKINPDGGYYLELEGVDDHPSVGTLKRAKDREHTGRLEAEKQAGALRERITTMESETEQRLKGVLPKENVEALEKSWGKKLADAESALTTQKDRYGRVIQNLTVDAKATELATSLARTPEEIPLLLPHIRSRLSVEISGEEVSLRVLDDSGKPTALSLKELRDEIIAKPMFAAVIVGSKASGGGASGGSGGGGAPPAVKDAATANPKDLAASLKAKVDARKGGNNGTR
jgi:hypothetical protein